MNKCETNRAAGFPVRSQGLMLVTIAAMSPCGIGLFESLFSTLTFILSAEQEKVVINHSDLMVINLV